MVLGKSATMATLPIKPRAAFGATTARKPAKDTGATEEEQSTEKMLMTSNDQLYKYLKQNQSGKIWRNAYYLSTSIEEDYKRHTDVTQGGVTPVQVA